MATFKTPGVYIREVPTLPPSAPPVATAIPVFIGYTENGTSATAMSPVRIESLLDYQQKFGGAYMENYTANLSGTGSAPITALASLTFSQFLMYRSLQLFYANGGADCYIISVGNYADAPTATQFVTQLLAGIDKAEEADEITLMVIPEANNANFSVAQVKSVNDASLAHCDKMQDRFAILDSIHSGSNTIAQDAALFRSEVGANFLKYGAAYYPPLKTTLPIPYSELYTKLVDTRSGTGYPVYTDVTGSVNTTGGPFNNLFSVKNGYAAWARIEVTATSVTGTTITISGVTLSAGVDYVSSAATKTAIAESIQSAINQNASLSGIIVAITDGQDQSTNGTLAVIAKGGVLSGTGFTISSSGTGITLQDSSGNFFTIPSGGQEDTTIYNSFITLLDDNLQVMVPSPVMAGIYTSVDNDRGVWKAPANVSVAAIDSPQMNVSDDDQAGLNVDPVGGKSINVIRNFLGRGTLVWGARTLAGNDNEWRYVPVRRLFIMAEETCKKASEFVVFEPNDKNTWNRVKGTIGNFLTTLWQSGGLTGDKPEQAYFVKVGLGETMTTQDILEGRMIVQVGLAAVRPAEFIILEFSHKLQEA